MVDRKRNIIFSSMIAISIILLIPVIALLSFVFIYIAGGIIFVFGWINATLVVFSCLFLMVFMVNIIAYKQDLVYINFNKTRRIDSLISFCIFLSVIIYNWFVFGGNLMIPIPIFQNVGTNVFSFSLISVRGIFDYYLTNIWFILLVGVLLGIFSYILTSKHIKPDLTIILRILIYLPKMMLLFLKNIYVRFTALSTFFMKNFVNIIRRRQEVFVPIIGKIASGKTTFLAALTQHISYSKYGTAEGDREELRSIYRIIGQSLDIASKKKPPTELGIHPIKFVINAPDKFNRWPKTLIVKTGDISGMDFEKETRVYRKIIQETPLIICLIDLYQKGIKIDKFNDSETIQTRFSKQFAEIAIGIESAMKFNNNLNVLFLYPKSDLHKFNEAVIKERLDISLSTLSARLERKDGNIFAPISFNSFDIIQGKTLDKMDRILANIFYATRMTKRLEKFPDIKFNDLSKENEGKKQRSGLN